MVFTKLTVKKLHKTGKRIYWECLCDCGNIYIARADNLLNGQKKSCGCFGYKRKLKQEWDVKHGDSKSKLYRVWCKMKYRCYNKNSKDYKDYGERGIFVCKEWIDDYCVFKEWAIENGYSPELSIDRINVNGNYSPDNCRWADIITQANNRRDTVYYDFNGEKLTIPYISKITGISPKRIHSRIYYGWSAQDAFTRPVRVKISGAIVD